MLHILLLIGFGYSQLYASASGGSFIKDDNGFINNDQVDSMFDCQSTKRKRQDIDGIDQSSKSVKSQSNNDDECGDNELHEGVTQLQFKEFCSDCSVGSPGSSTDSSSFSESESSEDSDSGIHEGHRTFNANRPLKNPERNEVSKKKSPIIQNNIALKNTALKAQKRGAHAKRQKTDESSLYTKDRRLSELEPGALLPDFVPSNSAVLSNVQHSDPQEINGPILLVDQPPAPQVNPAPIPSNYQQSDSQAPDQVTTLSDSRQIPTRVYVPVLPNYQMIFQCSNFVLSSQQHALQWINTSSASQNYQHAFYQVTDPVYQYLIYPGNYSATLLNYRQAVNSSPVASNYQQAAPNAVNPAPVASNYQQPVPQAPRGPILPDQTVHQSQRPIEPQDRDITQYSDLDLSSRRVRSDKGRKRRSSKKTDDKSTTGLPVKNDNNKQVGRLNASDNTGKEIDSGHSKANTKKKSRYKDVDDPPVYEKLRFVSESEYDLRKRDTQSKRDPDFYYSDDFEVMGNLISDKEEASDNIDT